MTASLPLRLRPALAPSLLLLATGLLPALEATPGDPALLPPLQPAWADAPLGQVLEDLAKTSGRPLTASPAVQKRIAAQERVTLIAPRPRALAAVVEDLEADQGIYAVLGPAGWQIGSAAEADARPATTRSVMELRAKPAPAAAMGLIDGNAPSFQVAVRPPKPPGKAAGDAQGANRAQLSLLDLLQGTTDQAEWASFSGNGPAFSISGARHRQARLLARLQRMRQLIDRAGSVRATFGILPATETAATGLVTRTEAAALIARLGGGTSLQAQVAGTLGGQARDLQERALVGGCEVVSGRLDPSLRTVRTGHALDARLVPTMSGTLLAYRLGWAELAGAPAKAEIRSTGGVINLADKTADAAGSTIAIALPTVWSWTPEGQTLVPEGHCLVLAIQRGDQLAVAVVEPEEAPTARLPAAFALAPGLRTAAEVLRTVAGQCRAGLASASGVRLDMPLTLPPEAGWPALVAACTGIGLHLHWEADRIVVEAKPPAASDPLPFGGLTEPDSLRLLFEDGLAQPGSRLPAWTVVRSEDRDPSELLDILRTQVHASGESGLGCHGPILLAPGPVEVRAHLANAIARSEDRELQPIVWRLWRLADDQPAGSVLDGQGWQDASAHATLIAATVGLPARGAMVGAGSVRAYLADADVVQGTYQPVVSDGWSSLAAELVGVPGPGGMHVAVKLGWNELTFAGDLPVLQPDGSVAVAIAQPVASLGRGSFCGTFPYGGAATIQVGRMRVAVTCEPVHR